MPPLVPQRTTSSAIQEPVLFGNNPKKNASLLAALLKPPENKPTESTALVPYCKGYKNITMPSGVVVSKHQFELAQLKEKYYGSLKGALEEVVANKKDSLEGIWNAFDLESYLQKTNQTFPSDYWEGYANPDYFQQTGSMTFVLKAGKKPSAAILAFFRGPTTADCGNVLHACHYKAVLDVIGEEKFDLLFSSECGIFRLVINQGGAISPGQPLYYITDFTHAAKKGIEGSLGNRPLEIGEQCYMQGVWFYVYKHPKGYSGGMHLIYVGKNAENKQLFLGFGFDRPMTELEIYHRFIRLYNKERTQRDLSCIAQHDQLFEQSLDLFYTLPCDSPESMKFVTGYLPNAPNTVVAEELWCILHNDVTDNLKQALIARKKARIMPRVNP